MFIFPLPAQFVLMNSKGIASGRRCLVGAPSGVTDVCMGFCAFEISWGVGWEWLRARGSLVTVGVFLLGGLIIWDRVSLGLCVLSMCLHSVRAVL